MEFCQRCQQIKSYRIVEYYNTLVKNCIDCGFQMGFIDLEEINNVITECNFYKKKFYEKELKNEKET